MPQTLMTSSKQKDGKRTEGAEVIRWIETHCRFTNARWHGQPFRLLPWQKRLILGLFEVDPETRRRLIRWAYISVPKKNGKTELVAALACWLLLASGEPVPLIICAAGSDDQADELFGAVCRMIEASPSLSKTCEVFESEVTAPSVPGGRIVRVSAAAKKHSSNLDGKNVFAVLCDELHGWEGDRGRLIWETLTNGTIARDEPLVIQITTAGFDRESICYQQYTLAKQVINGEIEDPAYFAFISEMEEDDDYTDPAVWAQVNPSFGVTVKAPALLDQLTKKPAGIWRRFFGNQWTRSAESWLPPGAWEAGESDQQIPEGADVTLGVDVALFRDHTAVAWCHHTDEGKFIVRCRTWAPPADGSGIDVTDVMAFIRELDQRFHIVGGEYDPRFFDVPGKQLADEGIPLYNKPQSTERMVPACGFAYEQIVAGNVLHEADPVLTEHVLSAAQRTYDNGWTLSKNKSKHVIDACIAVVLALSEWNDLQPATQEPFALYA